MRLTRFIRATAFRLTLVYVGIFATSIIIVSALIYFGAAQLWAVDIRRTVSAEIDDLVLELEHGGPSILTEAVRVRTKDVTEEGFVYLLSDPDGKTLAGQLASTSSVIGWQDVVPPRGEDDERFIAKGTMLSQGYFLVVGHDVHDLHETLELIEEGLAWTFGISLPLALLGGLIICAITLRRVEEINRATLRIRGGNSRTVFQL